MHLLRKLIWPALFYGLLFYSPLSGQTAELFLSLPWSDSEQGLTLQSLPEGRFTAQAFFVSNDTILILDTPTGMLRFYRGRQLVDQIKTPFDSRLLLKSGRDIFTASAGSVWQYQNGTWNEFFTGRTDDPVTELKPGADNSLNISRSAQKPIVISPKSQRTATAEISAERISPRLGRIGLGNRQFDLDFPQSDLASVRFIAEDHAGRIYLSIEQFVRQRPLKIHRELRQYDRDGTLLNVLHLPVTGFAALSQDLQISKAGLVYHALADAQGFHIYTWNLNSASGEILRYPESFYQEAEVTDDSAERTEQKTDFPQTADNLPQVTPEQSLATADTYVNFNWNCKPANVTNGPITDSYGIIVETPAWVQPGPLTKIAYKWGGFNTVDEYIAGLDAGLYAGDRYTSKNSGSPSAIGVDCSGFVSRCWNLPSHYSTRMMDDEITIPYENWDQTKPGDAAHIPGHVRLIVSHNPDGSLLVVEASGADWRVSYRNYTYSALTSYTPRYYINMQGTPGNIPQPQLSSVCWNDGIDIHWAVTTSQDVAGLNLYKYKDDMIFTGISDLDKNLRTWHIPPFEGLAGHFRVTSRSALNGQTESVTSDLYAASPDLSAVRCLVVDGFDRAYGSGSWQKFYHQFAADLGLNLAGLNLSFDTAANEAIISGQVHLADYPAVFWISGDESTGDESLSSTEQSLLSAYLRQGGKLFISGSEIAWDLDYKGSTADKAFIHDFLKAAFAEDDAGTHTAEGKSGTRYSGLTLPFDDGTHGIYNEDYPDVLTPQNGAGIALQYDNGKTAAVVYSGLFPGGSIPGKIFYMGFPLETIYETNLQRSLLEEVTGYFELFPSAAADPEPVQPEQFILYSNYPNPFNSTTTIRFNLPQTGLVELNVYDLSGRLIHSEQTVGQTGYNAWKLQTAFWASGIYLYNLKAGGIDALNGRMLLVK